MRILSPLIEFVRFSNPCDISHKLFFHSATIKTKCLHAGQNDTFLCRQVCSSKVLFLLHNLVVITALVSERSFNLSQKWFWRNVLLLQQQRAHRIIPAEEIKALSLFVLHSQTICHGASAATTSKKYGPISPDKTHTSEGWAVQGGCGRHRLRCMTKNRKSWQYEPGVPSPETQSADLHQFLLLRHVCHALLPLFGSSCRVINGLGQSGADEGQPDE